MKRARSEQIQSLVLGYLKKRNYTDSEASFKLELKFEETPREMTTRLSEDLDCSKTNSVALSVFDINDYFIAFEEFWKFCDQSSKKHPKIFGLAYPIFCHIYLDLVRSNRKGDATTFFNHFKMKIMTLCNPSYPPIATLTQVIKPSDVESNSQIREFRKKKFSINLSQESNDLLMRFLHANNCLVILKIINLHICINLMEDRDILDLFSTASGKGNRAPDTEKPVKKKKASSKANADTSAAVVKPEPVILSAPSLMSPLTPVSAPVESQPVFQEVDMKTLKEAIQKVYDLKPNVDNICLHRISNASKIGMTHTTFSSDFKLIASAMEDSTVRLWDMSLDEPDEGPSTSDNSRDVSKVYLGCDYPKAEQQDTTQRNILRAHSDTVQCTCFTHDNKYLISASEDTTVRLWDVSSRKNKVIYRGHVHPVWCVAMSNYSLYFATGSFDKTAKLWTTERTYPLRTFAGHHSDVESVAFHGNTTYLATADKSIRLWDISSGKTVRILLGHWAAIYSIVFSPNGKFIASAGEDGRIRLWDIASGTLIKEMRGHEGSVYTLDFSPDGSMLASGGEDSCLRVWNTRTSQDQSARGNTDTNDPSVNPDFIGRWEYANNTIHTVKFEATNLLHCVVADRL